MADCYFHGATMHSSCQECEIERNLKLRSGSVQEHSDIQKACIERDELNKKHKKDIDIATNNIGNE